MRDAGCRMKDVEFRTCNDVPGYPSSNIRQSASRVRQPYGRGATRNVDVYALSATGSRPAGLSVSW
jgi:hypothetical protein